MTDDRGRDAATHADENIELAQIITPAAALKTTARSRRNSILVGLLLGLIIGGIAAIVADTRKRA